MDKKSWRDEHSLKETGYPRFSEYRNPKDREHQRLYERGSAYTEDSLLDEYFDYNEETGRYDSYTDVTADILEEFIDNGEFTIPFGQISGDFDCSELSLKTLENGPYYVEGNFECSYNKLTTLKGAPKEVRGNFDCSYNNLTSLDGAPSYVGGKIYSQGNNIPSSRGALAESKRNYYGTKSRVLQENNEGDSLLNKYFTYKSGRYNSYGDVPREVLKHFVKNGRFTVPFGVIEGDFKCDMLGLKTLKNGPYLVQGDFDCSRNNLNSLEGAPKEVRGNFYGGYNYFSNSEEVPSVVSGKIYM